MRAFDWSETWTPEWSPLEVIFRASVIYLFVQVLMRIVGREELERYSSYDIGLLFLISTVARQSIVGMDTSLTSAMIGLTTIFAWEWLFSYASFHSRKFANLTEGPVRWLIANGEVCERTLERERISMELLKSRLRQYGKVDLSEVKDAFLERSGRITFVFWEEAGSRPS